MWLVKQKRSSLDWKQNRLTLRMLKARLNRTLTKCRQQSAAHGEPLTDECARPSSRCHKQYVKITKKPKHRNSKTAVHFTRSRSES